MRLRGEAVRPCRQASEIRRARAGSAHVHVRSYAMAGGVAAPGRGLAALLAMVVAAAASTAILNLYVDVQAKLRQQFRDYGAKCESSEKMGRPCRRMRWRTVRPRSVGSGACGSFCIRRGPYGRGKSVVVSGTDFPR